MVPEHEEVRAMSEPTLSEILDAINGLGARLDRVEIEVKETRDTVTSLDAKVEALDAKVEALDARVEALDARVEALHARVEALHARVEALHARVEALHARVEETRDTVGSLSLTVTRPRRTGTDGDD